MLWEYEEFGVKQLRYSPCRRQIYLRVRLDHVGIARKCLLWHMADADCSMSDFHLGGREGGGSWDRRHGIQRARNNLRQPTTRLLDLYVWCPPGLRSHRRAKPLVKHSKEKRNMGKGGGRGFSLQLS